MLRSSAFEPEGLAEAAAAVQRDLHGAAPRRAFDPAEVEEAGEERGPQRAREVWQALAPVETGGREGTAAGPRRFDVHPEIFEQAGAVRRDLEFAAVRPQRAAVHERGGEADAQATRQMVVAGAGRP